MPALGIGLGIAARTARAAPPAVPPADWRMPATVATSAGLTGSQAALQAAQATAASKARPGFTVPASGTEHVEWTVAGAGEVILSWLGMSDGTATVSKNGADQAFAPLFPAGSTVDGGGGAGGRRQFLKLTVAGSDVIRLTIAAGPTGRTIHPLLHALPASGPWDAHVAFGASREDQGVASKAIEDAVVAAFPGRDPIVFNYAKSGEASTGLAAIADDLATAYAGVARYALLGSLIGNDITPDPVWDEGERAVVEANIDTICAALAGFTLAFGNTSFRGYAGVTAAAQAGGALEWNDEVVHPKVLEHAPDCYDAGLLRARIDEYLAILRNRGALTDEVHGAGAAQRALWVSTWFARVYAGSWAAIGGEATRRVEEAEAAATVKATALTLYNEAAYALAALAASAAKSALQARLDAILAIVLFHEAVRLIDVAVAASTQPAKDAAQAALDAAQTAGYAGGTAPDTIAAQQARIDAVVIASFDQVVKVGFGSASAVATWNRTASTATGVIDADLEDDAGASTGIGITVSNAPSGVTTNAGLVSAVAEVPDSILAATWSDTANSIAFTITGLNPAKLYDVLLMPARSSGTVSSTRFTVQGAVQADVPNTNNVSQYALATSVAPNGSGEITIAAARGTGSSFCYLTAMILKRHA